MKLTLKRRMALTLGLSLVASLGALGASPAGATAESPVCSVILETTPGIEVDLNDDGYPEYRAPRIYDVTLCQDANAGVTTYPPTVDNCSTLPKRIHCVAVRVTLLPAYPDARVQAELCYTVEGDWAPTCVPVDSGDNGWAAPRTVCIGIDTEGGSPCGGGVVVLE